MEFHLGLDSTDGSRGGCTTWTFSKILDELFLYDPEITFLDFPKLIRLNPNIPFKTRGNAALSLNFKSKLTAYEIKQISIPIIKNDTNQFLDANKKPGLVIIEGKISHSEFYKTALQHLISKDKLSKLLITTTIWPDTNQSHVGALAAILADLSNDFTYEMITYREKSNFGGNRIIDNNNLKSLCHKYPSTFSSFDFSENRELIAPAGPDPILCGVRGENHIDLHRFIEDLKLTENIQSFTIFKTNQATNAHVTDIQTSLHSYSVISCNATVVSNPIEIPGGHVKLRVEITSNIRVDCMAFEPTKNLRNISRKLIQGDKIFLHGNIRNNHHGLHIALEYFYVTHLENLNLVSAPICICGKRMTSAGLYKGYKCKKCHNKDYVPDTKSTARSLFPGQKAYASLSAQRHLTRPASRIHIRNRDVPNIRKYNEFRKLNR